MPDSPPEEPESPPVETDSPTKVQESPSHDPEPEPDPQIEGVQEGQQPDGDQEITPAGEADGENPDQAEVPNDNLGQEGGEPDTQGEEVLAEPEMADQQETELKDEDTPAIAPDAPVEPVESGEVEVPAQSEDTEGEHLIEGGDEEKLEPETAEVEEAAESVSVLLAPEMLPMATQTEEEEQVETECRETQVGQNTLKKIISRPFS